MPSTRFGLCNGFPQTNLGGCLGALGGLLGLACVVGGFDSPDQLSRSAYGVGSVLAAALMAWSVLGILKDAAGTATGSRPVFLRIVGLYLFFSLALSILGILEIAGIFRRQG